MNPVFVPWLAEVVILSARSVQQDHRPPFPSEFIATFVVFGAMGAVASTSNPNAGKVAAVFSWGIVAATLLNAFDLDGKLRLAKRTRTVSQTPTGGPVDSATGGPAGTITTTAPRPGGGTIISRA